MEKINTQTDWDELARLNANWAVLTDPEKKFGAWKGSEFFSIGENRVREILGLITAAGAILRFDRALDFGCGTGRLTQALADHFRSVKGADISKEMLTLARQNLKNKINVEFELIDLKWQAGSDIFDLIVSDLTLQHLPDCASVSGCIHMLARSLKPSGALFFQLPSIAGYSVFKNRLMDLRSRFYYFLTGLGLSREFCFKRLRLSPRMAMQHLPVSAVKKIFENHGSLKVYNADSISTSYLFLKREI